jgi:flagellar motor switch protein FliN/FliY
LAADATAWLIEDWMSRLAGSVELMTEVRPGLTLGGVVTAGSPDIPADTLWHAIPLNLAGALVYLGASGDSWLDIGKSALLAAGVAEVTPKNARGTYLEIVTQSTSALAEAIAVRLGRPVATLPARQIRLGEDGFSGPTPVHPIEVSLGEPPPRILYVGWNRELESALGPDRTTNALERAEPGSMPTPKSGLPAKSSTFDLLMEVELPVSVSFGRAQLPLRDVLKLNSGSIVELNRTIADPVEIIVNNCVIARGEVVVVEGNYGVRIQHVISREERLRTLK